MKRSWFLIPVLGMLLVTAVAPGHAQSIYEIQLGTCCLPGDDVEISGVVVTGVFFNGFFVQEIDPDPTWGRQFSGIWVFVGITPSVSRGDLVNIQGTYDEYFEESEILVTGTGQGFQVVGTASVPPPVNVSITDVYGMDANMPTGPYDGLLAENYEGVLVEVTQTGMVATGPKPAGCFTTSPTRWGVYRTTAPTDTLFVRNSVGSHEIPPALAPINFLRGPMSFHRCVRKVVPRNNDDVGYVGPPNIVWAYSTGPTTVTVQFSRNVQLASSQNVNNYFFVSTLPISGAQRDPDDHALVHLTTATQPNQLDELFVANVISEGGAVPMPTPQSVEFWTNITPIHDVQFVPDPTISDISPRDGQIVTVSGVATSSNISLGTANFYMADGPGAWNGLRIAFTGGAQVQIGDRVMAAGQVSEFNGMTNIAYEGFAFSKRLGTGTPVAATLLDVPQLPFGNPALSEQWECTLVRVEDAPIDTTDFWESGEWFLVNEAAPGDTATWAKFDHQTSGLTEDVFDIPFCIGDRVNMQGNVRFAFGDYNIVPRRLDDVQKVLPNPEGCLTTIATGEVTVPITMLLRNYPNPFNPTTTIEFLMPAAERARVEIFDVSGRSLRTLVRDDVLPEGLNRLTWDGRDDAGLAVASGTYFYRVTIGNDAATERMTLLK